MDSIVDKDIIKWVADNRPKNKEEISQYLLDKKSLLDSILYLEPWVRNRKILFLGDDDHMSILLAYFFNIEAFIYEFDVDVRNSIKELSIKLDISERVNTFSYDARNNWDIDIPMFDAFHINPPFSKSNKGKGAILWLHRCLQKMNVNALGICNIPTTKQRNWSSSNWFEVQKFLTKNNCVINTISKPFQSYENVIPRRKIYSSIILMHKLGELQEEIIIPNNLYN